MTDVLAIAQAVHRRYETTLTTGTCLTPRFDLPRAWTPDGAPPGGEWEHGEVNFAGPGFSRGVSDALQAALEWSKHQ